MSDTRDTGSPKMGSPDENRPGAANTPRAQKSAMQQAGDLAGDLKKQASDVVQHATRQVKEQASDLTDSAKGLMSDAGEKLRSVAEEQKNAGADYVNGIAGSLRRCAGEFDQIPQAGEYIRKAADQVENASEALRRRDLGELVGEVQAFARRQPTAFLAATVLAGFAAVRFLKSATPPQSGVEGTSWQPKGQDFGQPGMPSRPQPYSPAGYEHRM